jgi:hypothetical protein
LVSLSATAGTIATRVSFGRVSFKTAIFTGMQTAPPPGAYRVAYADQRT